MMATKKTHPELVDRHLAIAALNGAAGNRQQAFTSYIILRFRNTGQFGPGCDMRDLQAWYDQEFGPREG